MPIHSLAHETTIRKALGYPSLPNLWSATTACVLSSKPDEALATIRLFQRNPEKGFRKTGIMGSERLRVVDDLAAHSRFAAAADVAAYLAATPELVRYRRAKRSGPNAVFNTIDLRSAAYLKLKEASAAIEGGQNPRARALLAQVRKICRRLRSDRIGDLLKANERLLWGRLLQLMWLPQPSISHFNVAKKRLIAAGLDIPPGVELLVLRAGVDIDPFGTRQALARVWDRECVPSHTNILGGSCEHYGHYIRAQSLIGTRAWEDAYKSFLAAEHSLEVHCHQGADPIRHAYSTLGRGRAKVGVGSTHPGGGHLDDGLNLLQAARSQFKELDFAPGEYLAHWFFAITKCAQGQPESGTPLELMREAHNLAQQTHVLKFQLDAGVAYGKALNDEGRMNAAHFLIQQLRKIDDPLVRELESAPVWDDLRNLEDVTRDAAQNGIVPTAKWGCSPYATDEATFVKDAARADWLVSAYGPPGSGRRIFLNRVATARGQRDDASVVTYSAEISAESLLQRVALELDAGRPLVLYNADRWPEDIQREALRLAIEKRNLPRLCYMALTKPLEDTTVGSQLGRRIGAALAEGAWKIQPLEKRPHDAPLLARGFLANALVARGQSQVQVQRLVLSGAACRFVRDSYDHIGDLYRAMRFLASRLMLGRDTVASGDGRFRLTLEFITKHLDPRPRASARRLIESSASLSPDGSPKLGREILDADAATIRDLAKKTQGRMARLVDWTDVPRATVIYAWRSRKMMDVWYDANGRRRSAARAQEKT